MTQLDRLEFKAAFTADETGTVTGKAWDFSSPDRVGDVIEPAAFAGAVGKSLPMLFAHDQAQAVGVWDGIAVESDGLKVTGKLLVDEVARAKEVRALLQAKAVTGLSVGFMTKKAAPRKGGGRTISDLDLVEVSLVAVPAHDGARVTNVKDMSPMTAATAENQNESNIDAKDLEAIQKRLDAIEAQANRLSADAANDNEPGDDVETKALNSWLRTGDVDAEIKTLVVGTPTAGGYTVAPEYSTRIITKLEEMNPLRRLAAVMSIGTSKVYIPTLASDAEGTWVSETGTRTEDEPTFGQVEIDVYEHAVIIPVSRQLLEDSFVDLQAFLADRIALKFAQAEATAFMVGDANGKPTGLIDNPALFDGPTESADVLNDIVDTFYALPSAYAQRGSWLLNRQTMGAIRKAADIATGRGSIWSDGLANGTPAMLLGRPVYEANDLDTHGSTATGGTGVVAAFGDIASTYQVVDRVGLQIMRDDFTGASTGVVKFHARRRVGGKTVLPEATVLLKAAA